MDFRGNRFRQPRHKGALRRSIANEAGTLIAVKTELNAVLDTMPELERHGFEVTHVGVQEDGLLDLDRFKAALRPDTIRASVMLSTTRSVSCRTCKPSEPCTEIAAPSSM